MQRGVGGIVAATVFVLLLVSIVGIGFALDETLKDTTSTSTMVTSTTVTATADEKVTTTDGTNTTLQSEESIITEQNISPTDRESTLEELNKITRNRDVNIPGAVPISEMGRETNKAKEHHEPVAEGTANMQERENNAEISATVTVKVRVPKEEVNKVVESVKKTLSATERTGEIEQNRMTKHEEITQREMAEVNRTSKEMNAGIGVMKQTKEQEKTMEEAKEQVKEQAKEQVKVSCSGGQCTVEIKVPKEKVEQMNKILEDVMGKEVKRAKTVAVAIPAPVRGEMQSEIEINGVKVRVECHHGACIAEMPAETARKTVMTEVAKQILEKAAPQAAKRLEIKKIETYNLVTDNVTAVMAQDKENNSTVVTYAATGYKTVAITVEIPKDVLKKASGYIEGNVIIVKDDPVLRIYLAPEGNNPSTASFTVKKAVDELGSTVIEFAACQIRVANVQTIPVGDKWQVSFQIRDGNTPVYLEGVHIVGAGVDVVPQYDAATKTYIATVKPAMGLKISAYVSGCGEITANVPKPTGNQGMPSIVVWGIVLAAIAVLGFGVWLNMKKK